MDGWNNWKSYLIYRMVQFTRDLFAIAKFLYC